MADPYEQMVKALMHEDNNTRNQAEAMFNQAKSNPDQLVTALVTLLRTNADQQVKRIGPSGGLVAGRAARPCRTAAPPISCRPTLPAPGRQVRQLCAVLLRKAVMSSVTNQQQSMQMLKMLSPQVRQARHAQE